MNVTHQIIKNICVVTLESDLALDRVIDVKEYVTPFLKDKDLRGLIINLDKTKKIDSSGVGMLMSLFRVIVYPNKNEKTPSPEGLTHFALCCVNTKVMKVFSMLRLENVVKMYPSESEGVASMQKELGG